MTPRAIPELKQRLAQLHVAPLRRDMDRMLELSTALEVEQRYERTATSALTEP